jgi:hypothetical protein
VRIALTLLVLMLTIVPCFADPPSRVRGISPKETGLIMELLARSETARALVSEIESTDLIVYVQYSAELPTGRAVTRLVTAAPEPRYLRVILGGMTHPADRGALLAHELQHAVEIGRVPDVRDDDGMRRLFAEIGEDRNARFAFETAAAREIGARVLRELAVGTRRRTE